MAVSETRPSAQAKARLLDVPALHLAAGKDQVSPLEANAEPLARAWAGRSVLRCLPKANHLGFLSGRSWIDVLLAGKPHEGTARLSRALLTAFLLRALDPDALLDELFDGELKGTQLLHVH
jgi:pimeloyl-ACP methyl ester carboxylesterase